MLSWTELTQLEIILNGRSAYLTDQWFWDFSKSTVTYGLARPYAAHLCGRVFLSVLVSCCVLPSGSILLSVGNLVSSIQIMSCHTYHCLVVVSFCILYSFTCQNETRKTTRFTIRFYSFHSGIIYVNLGPITWHEKSPSATKCHYNLHFYSNLIYFHPFMNRHEYKSMSNNFLKSHEFFSLNFSTILIIK